MVQRWKEFWLREYRDPDDYPDMGVHPNAWILDELHQLIFGGDYYYAGMVSSYLDRLKAVDVITQDELNEFVEKIYGELEDMRKRLRLPEPKQNIIPLPQ